MGLFDTLIKEITLFRIYGLDQSNFPTPVPLFQSFFADNGIFHGVVAFHIDQLMEAMLFCKSVRQIVFMLPDASGKVACYTDIERAVALVCEDVDARLFHEGAGM